MGNGLQNAYMAALWKFLLQEFVWWSKTYPQCLWKYKFSSNRQVFLSKLMQNLQFVYFNGLLYCPLEESLSKVPSWSNGHKVESPILEQGLNTGQPRKFKYRKVVSIESTTGQNSTGSTCSYIRCSVYSTYDFLWFIYVNK